MKPDFSILVPSYDPEGKKRGVLSDVLHAIDTHTKGFKYELIVSKNGPSYVESHNRALDAANSDWLIVVTDDVIIKDSDFIPKMTAHKDGIMSRRLYPLDLTGEMQPDFTLWSMHRNVFEKVGYFDEQYKDGSGYEDNDYAMQAKKLGFAYYDMQVDAEHLEALTLKTYYPDRDARFAHNKELFKKKWSLQ